MKTAKIGMLALLASTVVMLVAAKYMVTNPVDNELKGRVFAVDWDKAQKQNPDITPDNARVLDAEGNVLLTQTVDNDGDNEIDEILFVADVPGDGKKNVEIVADKSLTMPDTEKKTGARYVPERKGDFAWENDLIAFRAYGPGLKKSKENCGFDCWMKRVKHPIIDKWYNKISYHIDTGEGHDAYHVGDSLGCGGTAVWHEGKIHKSNVYTDWERYANGPLRSVFELSYGPWEVDGRKITETKRISIELGERMFRVDDTFYVDGEPAKLDIAVGLATHDGKADAYKNLKKGYMYCWEKINRYHFGTGVFVSPELIKEYKLIDTKKNDDGHALFVVNTGKDGSFTYYAGYGWEKAEEIVSRKQWENYIKDFIRTTENPPKIEMK